MSFNANEVVGICGLFCESCPTFVDGECHGCLSGHVAERCVGCRPGFRDCAKAHGITHCSECGDFPCDRLLRFRDVHVVDGISHHEHIMDYVRRQSEIGLGAWMKEQEALNACPDCGAMTVWCERKCRVCGRDLPRG